MRGPGRGGEKRVAGLRKEDEDEEQPGGHSTGRMSYQDEVSRRLGAKQSRSCRMSGETEGRRPGQASRPLEELPECRETFSDAYADAVGKPMLIREALC